MDLETPPADTRQLLHENLDDDLEFYRVGRDVNTSGSVLSARWADCRFKGVGSSAATYCDMRADRKKAGKWVYRPSLLQSFDADRRQSPSKGCTSYAGRVNLER